MYAIYRRHSIISQKTNCNHNLISIIKKNNCLSFIFFGPLVYTSDIMTSLAVPIHSVQTPRRQHTVRNLSCHSPILPLQG